MTAAVLSKRIFRAYDIRGMVGEALNVPIMQVLGHAIGSEALDLGERCLVVGADARLSSPAFHLAIINGILGSGCDVVNIGVVPTPLMYFATHFLPWGSGVMVTGSHNPKHYNGLKMVLQRRCLADNQIQNLHSRIVQGTLHQGQGSIRTLDLEGDYIKRICADIRLQRKIRVVVDCGNGVTGDIAPRLFAALGCEVIPLYCEMDGNFPNHHPDPSVPANLADLITQVRQCQADLGIALDGDGDRIGLVSNAGEIIDADRILMLFARDILPQSPGGRVVFDVKSSHHLPRLIREAGGEPLMCKSGHSFVKRSMQESGALLGGEYSAHIFFKQRWYGFDDGMYTAARFLELLDRQRGTSQDLLTSLPHSHSTAELFIPVEEDGKFSLMRHLQKEMDFPGAAINALDGLRVDFGHGWGLLRASNTTPSLTLRFEADSRDGLREVQQAFGREIARVEPFLSIPF